jgi:CRISPR/Cas system CSM-associated protein Csm2 small subunit
MLIRIAAVVTAYYLGRCGISIDELFKVLQVMLERHDRQKK